MGEPTTTVFRGAKVIDPASGIEGQRDIVVRGAEIAGIGAPADPPGDASVVDASGLVIAPGLIDPHVHLREPGGEEAETIASGCEAAARGGFTSVWAMPNTRPACDSPTVVRYMRDRAREANGVRVVPIAAVTVGQGGETLCEYRGLAEAGAGAFSDDGHPVADAGVMRRAMQNIADIGGIVMDHCEDMRLTGPGVMHEGSVSARLGLPGLPRSSEATNAARDCELALETGCRLHICHVSNRSTVEVLRFFKSRGAPITAEVSPHHLTMTDEDVERLGPLAKMKPPLCDASDRDALIDGVEDATIDCIATDHAPHPASRKHTTMEEAAFGIIGLETALPVVHRHFVRTGRWALSFVIDRMSAAPAKLLGSTGGRLQPGGPADLVLIDPDAEYELDASSLGSASTNCPWLGERFSARIVGTMAAGRWAFRAERCTVA